MNNPASGIPTGAPTGLANAAKAQAALNEDIAKFQAAMPKPAVRPVLAAISAVMGEVGSVKKEGFNEFHRYNYAAAADVMHALQPLLAKNGLTIVQHQAALEFIQDGAAMAIRYEFHLYHSSGDKLDIVPVHTGVAAAKTKTGSPDDKAANKCHTAARKYFLLSLFQIPTGDYADPDADGDVPQVQKPKAPTKEAVNKELERVAPKKPAGGSIALNMPGGEATYHGTMTAYLDAFDTALNSADDQLAFFDLNSSTLGELQAKAVAAKTKPGDAIVTRITEIHARIHALTSDEFNPLKGA
jgi:hypothetical protein